MSRVRWVGSRKELERSVDEFITRGYSIQSMGEQSARMREKDWGDAGVHLLIAGITIWWTFGLANALYAVYKRATAEEVFIRIEEADTDRSDRKDGVRDQLAERKSDTTEIDNGTTEGNKSAWAVEIRSGDSQTTQPVRDQKTRDGHSSRWSHNYRFINWSLQAALQVISLSVTGLVLFTILAVYAGAIGLDVAGLVVATLSITVLFRYTAVYHPFGRALYKNVAVGLSGIAFLAIVVFTGWSFVETARFSQMRQLFRDNAFQLRLAALLPEWWIASILAVAGILVLSGTVVAWDFESYPKPTSVRGLALSPVYFGATGSLFGLWAVLFVGISIQRIIIVAPIFEESLKFGAALLVGSVLFGRSLSARIGSAIVVGSLFGFIEHATSYPTEADAVFLFRTLFHMMTTVLSVSIYTVFESHGERSLQWISPVYAMLIHFFYNTFVVLSGLVFAILGVSATIASQLYGGAAILLLVVLFVLALTRYEATKTLHLPFSQVLSDFA